MLYYLILFHSVQCFVPFYIFCDIGVCGCGCVCVCACPRARMCVSLHFNFKHYALLLFRLTVSFFGHTDSIHKSFITVPRFGEESPVHSYVQNNLTYLMTLKKLMCFPTSLIIRQVITKYILSNINLKPT